MSRSKIDGKSGVYSERSHFHSADNRLLVCYRSVPKDLHTMMRNRLSTGGSSADGRRYSDYAFGVLTVDINSKKACNEDGRKRYRRSITMGVALLFSLFFVHELSFFTDVDVFLPEVSLVSLSSGVSMGNTDNANPTTQKTSLRITNNVPNTNLAPESETNDRYKLDETVYSLPTNSNDYSMIESMVQSFYGRDQLWYEACAKDNSTQWIKRVREHGGDSGRFFDRACPNMGNHPDGVHWNPFHNVKHNCSATSRINVKIQRDHFWEGWQIQTLDASGVPKSVGGDYFYVYYSEYLEPAGRDVPVAVAIPTDHNDGTYGLEFVSVPFLDDPSMKESTDRWGQRKKGKLSIHPITTCFIGELYPPLKDGWNTGGSTSVTWTIEDITRPSVIQDWYADRYIDKIRDSNDPKKKVRNSLLDFDRVVFAGDSILSHMTWDEGSRKHHPIVREKIKNGKIWSGLIDESYGGPPKIHLPLSKATLEEFWGILEPFIQGGLSDNSIKKKALVTGSAAWDIIWPAEWQGPNFDNHLATVETLIKRIRSKYPDVTVVWKLPYAHHMHVVDPVKCIAIPENNPAGHSCINILRYATKQRFEKLYYKQKRMIERRFANDDMVQLLDLYEVSYLSAHAMGPGDSIHYLPWFHKMILRRLLYRKHELEVE